MNVSGPSDDPLSSVIQDLNKLTTESSVLDSETILPSKELQTRANDEFFEDSIDSPDSLDIGNVNNRPIPPPRTKVPVSVPTSCNNGVISSSTPNNIAHKQMRSESDTDLLLSLTGSGNYSTTVFYNTVDTSFN